MSHKKRKSKPRVRQVGDGVRRSRASEESPPAVAVTVAWLLCCLTTLGATLLMCLARGAHATWHEDQMSLLAGLFQFVSFVTGGLVLVLTVLALRLRRSPPPVPITWLAVIIGLLPIVIWVVGSILE